MRVLAWVLVWALLVAGSIWYLWRRLRGLGRATSRLAAELSQAERVLGEIQREAAGATRNESDRHAATNPVHATAQATDAPHLALFTGLCQAVAERRAVRRALNKSKRARRAANLPGWARRVDSHLTAPRKASP